MFMFFVGLQLQTSQDSGSIHTSSSSSLNDSFCTDDGEILPLTQRESPVSFVSEVSFSLEKTVMTLRGFMRPIYSQESIFHKAGDLAKLQELLNLGCFEDEVIKDLQIIMRGCPYYDEEAHFLKALNVLIQIPQAHQLYITKAVRNLFIVKDYSLEGLDKLFESFDQQLRENYHPN